MLRRRQCFRDEPAVYFLAMDRDFVRGDKAQLDAVSADFNHGDEDVRADHNPFAHFAAENQGDCAMLGNLR